MDPTAALMTATDPTADSMERATAAGDLTAWIARGGFAPDERLAEWGYAVVAHPHGQWMLTYVDGGQAYVDGFALGSARKSAAWAEAVRRMLTERRAHHALTGATPAVPTY